MNKLYYLAALAAVALSLGFTACDDDDENEPVQDGYTLTINVHTDVMGNDTEEFVAIYNAYRTAFGLDELEKENENESVSFTGKDSIECVKRIQECCAKAETTLYGMTWEDVHVISVRDTTTNTAIYTKQYGVAADNGSVTYRDFDMADHDFPLTKRHYFPSNGYVTAVYIDSRSNMISPYTWFWQNHYVGKDLNQGAGGNYVYPSYGLLQIQDGADWSYIDKEKFVGGLLVLDNQSGYDPPKSFYFENRLYTISVDVSNLKYAFDLNHKAGGSYLYLYTTTSDYTGKVLKGSESGIYSADHDISREKENLVRGVTYDSRRQINMKYPYGVDLNMGAGGDYMYWREIYTRPWSNE